MRIAAISDVHSPRYLSEFKSALEKCESPDVFLLAGDMIDSGKIEEYRNIADAITNRFGEELPIVACFGNDEHGAQVESVQKMVGERITFLDGETTVISIRGTILGILGVPVLDVANSPQDSSLEEIFKNRIQYLAQRLGELKRTCDRSIVLMHYSPLSAETYPVSFSWWVLNTFKESQPDLVVHGHIHYATNPDIRIGIIRVINVAFPSTRKITDIPF
ncbi:MAG: metallophosphoesterase [Candidatus Thorarchaeota archaeon]|nr:metallophosphoesterase [Candidatus Thorarchaeota archaeon]